MNSLELRKDPSSGERIVMYGFESKPTIRDLNGNKIIFLGTKEELIEKPEEWIARIVQVEDFFTPKSKLVMFRDYEALDNGYACDLDTAKDSLLSAIESTKGNNFLIVRERI